MSELSTKIRVRIGDREIEVEGSEEYVNSKFAELKDEILNIEIPPPVRTTRDPTPESESTIELPDNLPAFLSLKGNPRGFQDISLVFAEWLLRLENIEPFSKKSKVLF